MSSLSVDWINPIFRSIQKVNTEMFNPKKLLRKSVFVPDQSQLLPLNSASVEMDCERYLFTLVALTTQDVQKKLAEAFVLTKVKEQSTEDINSFCEFTRLIAIHAIDRLPEKQPVLDWKIESPLYRSKSEIEWFRKMNYHHAVGFEFEFQFGTVMFYLILRNWD